MQFFLHTILKCCSKVNIYCRKEEKNIRDNNFCFERKDNVYEIKRNNKVFFIIFNEIHESLF
jgi:hypothetical protein